MQSELFWSSRADRPKLRVGLLLDSFELPRCFAEVLQDIERSNFASISLIVLNSGGDAPLAKARPASTLRTLSRVLRDPARRDRMLFGLYQKWDARFIDPAHDPLAPVDCSARLEGIETLRVTPIAKRFVHRFPEDALAAIRAAKLDVLIRFGFNILRGGILDAARYGIWSYHHGDNDQYRGGPPYFWEIYERNPVSAVVLQRLTEQLDAGLILSKGYFATSQSSSMSLNRRAPYWGATTFVIQKLRELHERGWETVEAAAVPPSPYRGRKAIYRAPTNREMLRWIGPVLTASARRRLLRGRRVQHWRLAFRAGPQSAIDDGAAGLDGFRWIESPPGRFFADPFLLERDGQRWVFFEDFDYASGRGHVSCAPIDRHDGLGAPIRVLDRPYHLSYPCVFSHDGELFMVPETWYNGAVELYRCRRFPDDWRLEKTLFQGRAVDTSVWIDKGRCWFFVTLLEPHGYGSQLWVFHSESLTGAWTPHPASPLSTDVRTSRGAGAILQHNGRLLRPSQDCSAAYGQSFTLNEIQVLDPARYEERPAVRIGPVRGLVGTHTYGRLGEIEVVDGCTEMPAKFAHRSSKFELRS